MDAKAEISKRFYLSLIVPFLLLLLGATAIASGVVRLSSMTQALSSDLDSVADDMVRYIENPIIAAIHLIPGIAFMLLGPLQFIPMIRKRWPTLHRWSGRIVIGSGILVGISAVSLAVIFPVLVNSFTTAANFTFGTALIIALVIALRAILRRDFQRHRAWMIRAFAIGLSVATIRAFFGILFLLLGEEALSNLSLPFMVWFTFLFNIMVAETILWRERIHRNPI